MTNPNKIKIHFRCKNPGTATTSNPIKIRTYTDTTSNVIIDEDITNAVILIANYRFIIFIN